jgi:hypothetical protein
MKSVIQISFPISCVSLLPVANFNWFDNYVPYVKLVSLSGSIRAMT